MTNKKIDIHTHAFHPKIAAKATAYLHEYYKLNLVGDGTLPDLQSKMHAAGIDYSVVHSAATSASQVIPANDWAIELQHNNDDILAFGTMHPEFIDIDSELTRLEQAGIKGLKIHPDFQQISLADKSFNEIFEAAVGRFVMMFHVGDEKAPEDNYSCPFKIAKIQNDFPDLKIIAAHFGGLHHWKFVAEELGPLGVYIDTSGSLDSISDSELRSISKAIPRERWLFGSDYPIYSPEGEIEALKKRLQLSSADVDELMYNGARLLFS